MSEILIASIADDLHALNVQAALRKRRISCSILETDRIWGRECLSLAFGETRRAEFIDSEGKTILPSQVDVVWWRRYKVPQQLSASSLSEDQISIINNDSFATLVGSLEVHFRGTWISAPRATDFASNKINQLDAAKRCGFRIPDTLITQSPDEVRSFYQKHLGRVVFKPVAGTPGPLIFTQFLSDQHLDALDAIRCCPAIYQEFIPGQRHIRLNCFGSSSYAALIVTDDLDWRPNLNVPISTWRVPDSLHTQIRAVLDDLGLQMGILDLKETPAGEIVWLEVNPQGQFLFLEGLTGEPLTEHFAEYLSTELRNTERCARNTRSASSVTHAHSAFPLL